MQAMHSHLMRRSRTSNYAHYFPDQSPDYSPDHSPPNSPPTAIVPARRSSTTDDDVSTIDITTFFTNLFLEYLQVLA